MTNFNAVQKLAVEAAQHAATILQKYQKRVHQKNFRITEKKDAGIVTEADFAAEKKIVSFLKKHGPAAGFLTEEKTVGLDRGPEWTWVIDPLDGTTNFAHGFPMYCVSIGLLYQNRPVVGVIQHPVLNDVYVAQVDQGARLNGKKIHVSTRSDIATCVFSTGFSYQKGPALRREIEKFARVSAKVRAVRRPGSAALDLAYVARGVFDGFWESGLAPWDMAAGALLVQEAGGCLCFGNEKDSFISSIDIFAQSIFASNQAAHASVKKLLWPNI